MSVGDLSNDVGGEYLQQSLVTVAPGEVLGANVLVGVLDTLLQRGHMGPVLPVLVPENVGVGGGEGQSRGDGAACETWLVCGLDKKERDFC